MVHCGRCLPEGVMGLALKWSHRLPYLCYVHGEDVSTATESRELAWLVRRSAGQRQVSHRQQSKHRARAA